MADIALLVAEEFERRRNRMEKGDDAKGGAVEFSCTASSSLLSRAGEEISSLRVVRIKEMEELLGRAMEPKSTFGVAAFDGFFSA